MACLWDWPFLCPQSVLQLFGSALHPGEDVVLNPGAVQLFHLRAHLPQLQRKRLLLTGLIGREMLTKNTAWHTCLSMAALSVSSWSLRSFSWISLSCSCSFWNTAACHQTTNSRELDGFPHVVSGVFTCSMALFCLAAHLCSLSCSSSTSVSRSIIFSWKPVRKWTFLKQWGHSSWWQLFDTHQVSLETATWGIFGIRQDLHN